MKGIIRVGDPTSHGGRVISGTSRMLVDGKPVARVGDACTCPIKGHGSCVIVEGDPNFNLDGIPVAFHGAKLSCGGSALSATHTVGIEPLVKAMNRANQWQGVPHPLAPLLDEQVRAIDADTGEPIPDLAYYIEASDGSIYTGHTDDNGCCKRIATANPEELSVWFGEEAEEKQRSK